MEMQDSQIQIHLDAPNIGDLEKKQIGECLDSTFVSTHGPFVPEFEANFSRFLDCNSSVAVQSGTAGLHMALHELGIKEGDEVILPVLTFISTANVVKYVGAKPVFVDVDPITWTIDTTLVEEAVTNKTKAIMPVHLFGNPCAMDNLLAIAKKNNLYIIEDATESFGSKVMGRHTGTLGDFGVFSFNGNKMITTGGGGMIVGSDKDGISHIRFLVNQARDEKRGYFHPEIGFNYRMTNLEASLGLAQLERLPEFIEKKKEFHNAYRKSFTGYEEIQLQKAFNKSETIWWLTSLTVDTEKVNMSITDIQTRLKDQGVPSRRIFTPIVEFPAYSEADKGRFKQAYRIYEKGLCLPGSTLNEIDSIEYAADVLIHILTDQGLKQFHTGVL